MPASTTDRSLFVLTVILLCAFMVSIADAADRGISYCDAAADLQKRNMAAEWGSARGFEENRCDAANIHDLSDDSVVVVASYDTAFGFTPYIAHFEASASSVICESVDEACAKNRPMSSFIQTELNEKINAGLEVDGVWGRKTEQALWDYGRMVGLTKNNASTISVILALVSGDVRQT